MNHYKEKSKARTFFQKLKCLCIMFLSGNATARQDLIHMFLEWRKEDENLYYSQFIELTENDDVLIGILNHHGVSFPHKSALFEFLESDEISVECASDISQYLINDVVPSYA